MKQVKILTRYELKNTGGVIYHIENGSHARYYTGLYTSGDCTCTCAHGQSAGSHAHCYHVDHCQKREAARVVANKAAAAEVAARRQEDALAMAELAAEIAHESMREMMHATARMPERTRRSSLNDRELHFVDGILMR